MKHRITMPRLGRGRVVALTVAAGAIGAIVFGGVAASAGTSSPTATQAWTKGVVQVETNWRTLADHQEAAARSSKDNQLLHYSQQLYNQAVAYTNAHLPAAPSVTSVDVAGTTLPHIGGSWGAGHVALDSKQLDAGTYLVTVTGDFYKVATTAATPVLQIQVNGLPQQITAYTGAFPANAAEGVGLGSDGTPNGLEQTASAYATVVVPDAGATAELDAFGYNPDRSGNGAGDFGVIAHAAFTKVG
ncbi:MAG TPA: hypothetical protein VH373_19720 [Jatrophihabitantaceae bacterium]|jgi:hypothetical protein